MWPGWAHPLCLTTLLCVSVTSEPLMDFPYFFRINLSPSPFASVEEGLDVG
jgi:hypothetical protein